MDEQLSRQSDALLRGVPQDSEYPFYSEEAEQKRNSARGRANRFREVALTEMVNALDAGPEEQVVRVLTAQDLLRRAGLTREERCIFLLSHLGHSNEEIAFLQDRDVDTVAERRRSARVKLRAAAATAGLMA